MRKPLSVARGLTILSLMVILGGCAHGPPADGMLQWQELQVVDLNMSPDPVRPGEQVRFYLDIQNRSYDSGEVTIYLHDRDQLIASVHKVWIQRGTNRITFPWTNYHFQKQDHCFVVKVNIRGNEYPIDMAKKFCAYRVEGGWSLR
jgi:hypothetical protein